MQWLEQTSVKAPAWPGVSSPNAGQFVERAQLSHTRSPSCCIAAVLSTSLSCRSSQCEWPRAEPGWSQGGERPLGLDRGCPELGSLPARPDLGGDKQDQLQLQPQTCSSGAPVSTQSKHTPLLHTARSCIPQLVTDEGNSKAPGPQPIPANQPTSPLNAADRAGCWSISTARCLFSPSFCCSHVSSPLFLSYWSSSTTAVIRIPVSIVKH